MSPIPNPILTPLTHTEAHLLGFTFAAIYVGSLYVSKNGRLVFSNSNTTPSSAGVHTQARAEALAQLRGNGEPQGVAERQGRLRRVEGEPPREKNRDDPDVIRARLIAVSFATVLCLMLVWAVVWVRVYGKELDIWEADWNIALGSLRHALALLGLSFPSIRISSLLPHLVIPTLFLGPLTALLLSTLASASIPKPANLQPLLTSPFSLISIRNYVIAPITEELVFRSCILAAYMLTLHPSTTLGLTPAQMILFSPLHFGLAHLHHAWDTYNRFGRTSSALKRAILQSSFQMLYTTLFGALCAFLFLRGVPTSSEFTSVLGKVEAFGVYPQRTPSVLAPISAHIFCNIMGFPDFNGDVNRGRYSFNLLSRGKLGGVGGWVIRVAYLTGVSLFGWAVWSERGKVVW